MQPDRKCIIATPAHSGQTDVLYTYALAETIRAGMLNGVMFLPLILPGEAIIQKARNELLAMVHASDVQDVIWIDADMGWDPAWPLRLLSHRVDIVGGTARRKTEEIETYVCKCDPEKLEVRPDGLMKVEGLGAAFTRMSRKAIDALWDSGAPYVGNDGGKRRWAFDVVLRDFQVMSEDIYGCEVLSKLGMDLYLDTTMTCVHVGRHEFKGDFSKWLADFKRDREIEKAAAKVDKPKLNGHAAHPIVMAGSR